jgi:hypothetical protein
MVLLTGSASFAAIGVGIRISELMLVVTLVVPQILPRPPNLLNLLNSISRLPILSVSRW